MLRHPQKETHLFIIGQICSTNKINIFTLLLRFVDVVESVVSQQRPEAVIDVLHSKCVGDVETNCKSGLLPQGGAATEADYKKGGTRETTIAIDVSIPKVRKLDWPGCGVIFKTICKSGLLPQGGDAIDTDYKKGGTRETTIAIQVSIYLVR